MNLLTVAPLIDSKGNTRYHIGAQVDVTGLCKDCVDLDGLKRVLERKKTMGEQEQNSTPAYDSSPEGVDEFQELTEMFNDEELEIVRKSGGRMHQAYQDYEQSNAARPRLHVRDPSSESPELPSPKIYNSIGQGKNASLFPNVSHFIAYLPLQYLT
jgi:hypothetical protein